MCRRLEVSICQEQQVNSNLFPRPPLASSFIPSPPPLLPGWLSPGDGVKCSAALCSRYSLHCCSVSCVHCCLSHGVRGRERERERERRERKSKCPYCVYTIEDCSYKCPCGLQSDSPMAIPVHNVSMFTVSITHSVSSSNPTLHTYPILVPPPSLLYSR